jgi:hypothetical protein
MKTQKLQMARPIAGVNQHDQTRLMLFNRMHSFNEKNSFKGINNYSENNHPEPETILFNGT